MVLRTVVLALVFALAAGEAIAQTRQQQIQRPRNPPPSRDGATAADRAALDEQYAIQVLIRAARLDEAEPRARAAVAEFEARNADSWVFAWALSNLGQLLHVRGRFAEARPVFDRARAVMDRLPATTAPATRAGILGRIGRMRQAEGRADEALALAREAVAFREQAFAAGIDPPNLAGQIAAYAADLMFAGRAADGEREARRSIVVAEQRFGPDHSETAYMLYTAADLLKNRLPTAELRAMAERAYAIASRGGDAPLAARAGVVRAYALEREGRFAEAEADVRRALPIVSRGGDEIAQATALVRLASLLAQRAAIAEAERAVQAALPVIERHLGRDNPLVGFALAAQGRAWRLAGRPAEAEPVLRRAIAIRQRGIVNDSGLPGLRVEHALALEQLGRVPEAIAALEPAVSGADEAPLRVLAILYWRAGRADQAEASARRALEVGERTLGPDAPLLATTRAWLGRILVDRGKAAEAETHLRVAVAVQERTLGARHPDVAAAWYGLALALDAQAKLDGALEAARKAAQLTVDRGMADDEGAERIARREVFALVVSLIARALPRAAEGAREALLAEAFRALQRAKEGPTAAAVSRMAERAAVDDPRLAELLRARSDASDAVAAAAAALRLAVSRGGGGDRGALDAARARRTELDRQLARDFPAYARLFGGVALSPADVRAVLGPDEALVDFLVLPQQLYAMVLRPDGAWLVAGDPALAREVPALVRRLRASVDPGNATSLEELPRYDMGAAYRLWQAALAGTAPLLAGASHLFVVPDGALQSVPFAMLLTEPYEGDLRAAPWLLIRFATTTLPGASTLRALRAVARPVQASEPFLGVGNPVLAGLPDAAPGSARAAAARGGARPLFVRRGRPPQMSRLFTRNGTVDVRALRELAPLPETADELRALARALGAGGDALLLAADATKRRVRAMDLSRYRVIAFATHGLTAGDVPGFGEPGLVLTPPERATPEDDGVLGVSAIARLRLDADLVILSACNTASPDGTPGAEALSGLARAFLYAGARSLLVSHWPVVSTSAVELTTGLVAAQQADPTIGRAAALRRAQQRAIAAAASTHAAHPLLWAPFVLVGEGGRPIAVAAPSQDASQDEPEEEAQP